MIKKVMNTAKATLLAATLLITGLTAIPQIAHAWVLTIYCDGTDSLCATINFNDDSGTYLTIEAYLGNFMGFTFET
jgi:hypothetical protein